eukprot:1149734-Pelagomonas_calceolata.AAC.1
MGSRQWAAGPCIPHKHKEVVAGSCSGIEQKKIGSRQWAAGPRIPHKHKEAVAGSCSGIEQKRMGSRPLYPTQAQGSGCRELLRH